MPLNITGGSGGAKRVSLISVPLIDSEGLSALGVGAGLASGKISSTSSGSITVDGAGWLPGSFSDPSKPYAIEIISGVGEAGSRVFLISSQEPNTSDTVYIDSGELSRHGSLRALNVLEANFRIYRLETLSSFFGTPETTGILGGSIANLADTVVLVFNGSASTYYYSTTLNRWTRVGLGTPDASNIVLLPHYGIQYSRLHPDPLRFIVTGEVPFGKRAVPIRDSGPTLLSAYWAREQSLGSLGLENVLGWRSGASASVADVVSMSVNGSTSTFFYDGTNWRRVTLGTPISNGQMIPMNASILLNRKSQGTTHSIYENWAPY
jgi:hypothetical protein